MFISKLIAAYWGMQVNLMKTLHKTEILRYEIFNLNYLNELADVVAKAFVDSDPMAIAQKFSLEEFADYIKLLGTWAETEGLTVIAKDKFTNELVGAVIAGDLASDSPLHMDSISEKFNPILYEIRLIRYCKY